MAKRPDTLRLAVTRICPLPSDERLPEGIDFGDPDGLGEYTDICMTLWEKWLNQFAAGARAWWEREPPDLRELAPKLVAAVEAELAAARNRRPAGDATADCTPILMRMSDVTPKEIEWLWWPYIAIGKLGLPGAAGQKSTLACPVYWTFRSPVRPTCMPAAVSVVPAIRWQAACMA